jgi:hypothetical protein
MRIPHRGGSSTKRIALIGGATIAIAMTALAASPGKPQEEVLMPEVSVRGQAVDRRHPQDGTGAERPLGCVEVITPNTGEDGYFQARFAKEGIPVMPDLNNPSSASGRRATLAGAGRVSYYQHPATPAGREGKAGCAQ